jgi:type 1 glutamine amidotransferase
MRQRFLAATLACLAFALASPTSAADNSKPIQLLIVTGDEYHNWKESSKFLAEFLSAGGKIHVMITSTPNKDLTDENLARFDVILLDYKDTNKGTPETRWSESNKEAFLKAIKEGKGLVMYHYASSAFTKPNWVEFEKATAGGWRSQGYHGPAHAFKVKKTDVKHPISEGLVSEFDHNVDELYSNSLLTPGSVVLATAYCDPAKPKGTGKDEAIVWVNHYGKGRVYQNVMGHDVKAMSDPNFQAWMKRGVIWAARGEVPADVK